MEGMCPKLLGGLNVDEGGEEKMKATIVIGPQYTRGEAPTVRAFAMCGVRDEAASMVIVQRLYSPGRPVGDNPEEAFKAEAKILMQIMGAICAASPQVMYAPDGPDAVADL